MAIPRSPSPPAQENEARSEQPPEEDFEDTYRPQEPWHVEDDEVKACIPTSGMLKDYMDYVPETCDGASWFQLGGFLTMLSVVAGKIDYQVEAANGRFERGGLHLWSANVGYTGARKSQCVRPAMSILKALDEKLILPSDFSIEAVHDLLAQAREGIGLFHRDEMSTIFAQAKRGYSSGLIGWMLEAYNGGPTERLTKSGGSQRIDRVRLSVLGNIPPSTLQQNTTREDWRTGFMPRFLFWGARRTRQMPIAPEDPKVTDFFMHRLKKYIYNRQINVVIPHPVARILTDWHRRDVDSKGAELPDELYSALLRLRSKGFQIASKYALARLDYVIPAGKKLLVSAEDAEYALEVIKLHRRSTTALFGYVGGSEEATHEKRAVAHIAANGKASPATLAGELGISVKDAAVIFQTLSSQGLIERKTEKSGGRGRPRIVYTVPT